MDVTQSHGVVIKIGNGGTPSETFATLLGVHNGPKGPSWSQTIISARHHGSDTTLKRHSVTEVGAITFDLYYDSTDTAHQNLSGCWQDGTLRNFQMIIPDEGAEAYEFSAYVDGSYSGDVDGFNVYSVTLTPSGDVTAS